MTSVFCRCRTAASLPQTMTGAIRGSLPTGRKGRWNAAPAGSACRNGASPLHRPHGRSPSPSQGRFCGRIIRAALSPVTCTGTQTCFSSPHTPQAYIIPEGDIMPKVYHPFRQGTDIIEKSAFCHVKEVRKGTKTIERKANRYAQLYLDKRKYSAAQGKILPFPMSTLMIPITNKCAG